VFLFVAIMVYLLMSRFLLLLNDIFYYMFHVLFAIKVPCQRDTKIKDVYTVKALETVNFLICRNCFPDELNTRGNHF